MSKKEVVIKKIIQDLSTYHTKQTITKIKTRQKVIIIFKSKNKQR